MLSATEAVPPETFQTGDISMSTSIDQSFIRDYDALVHEVFQRRGGILRSCVRTKDNVVGTSTTFQKVGKGTASTKARHGQITPMNQTHTAIECTISDFYAGDWVDRLDEAKINIDERRVLAEGGAMALGRKVDDQILTALDATTQPAVGWTETSGAAIRNSMIEMVKALLANDVPNVLGENYGVLSPQAWAFAMTVDEFKRADYVGPTGLPFKEGAPVGQFIRFMNILWTMHTGVPGVGTATAKVFVWNKKALGYAAGAHPMNVAASAGNSMSGFTSPVMADITWHGDRAAHFVNHWMSGGAVLIDDTGVIEGTVDDTQPLPTT